VRSIWLVSMVVVVGCGEGGQSPGPDAPPDAAPPIRVDEAADCGGRALVARAGDQQLIVTRLEILTIGDSFDLDNDGDQDNKLSAMASLAQSSIDDGLTMGTYAVPIEIFDRTGDPDACVKLALYRGACSGTCNFTDGAPDTVTLDAASFETSGDPRSRMRAMSTDSSGVLRADPGVLLILVPTGGAGELVFPISVQRISGLLGSTGLTGFRIGGVMQPFRMDATPVPPNEQIGVVPGDTLLDMTFANLLGPLLALPKSLFDAACRTADIDIDLDGLESFCDSDPDDAVKRVDTCIDGDGTIVRDGDDGLASCTDAMIGGVRRFPDGVSAALELDASAVTFAP
jgi:hypothetical protein